eukprot:51244-Eustigmatos_ZCMA.PRE.1
MPLCASASSGRSRRVLTISRAVGDSTHTLTMPSLTNPAHTANALRSVYFRVASHRMTCGSRRWA